MSSSPLLVLNSSAPEGRRYGSACSSWNHGGGRNAGRSTRRLAGMLRGRQRKRRGGVVRQVISMLCWAQQWDPQSAVKLCFITVPLGGNHGVARSPAAKSRQTPLLLAGRRRVLAPATNPREQRNGWGGGGGGRLLPHDKAPTRTGRRGGWCRGPAQEGWLGRRKVLWGVVIAAFGVELIRPRGASVW